MFNVWEVFIGLSLSLKEIKENEIRLIFQGKKINAKNINHVKTFQNARNTEINARKSN